MAIRFTCSLIVIFTAVVALKAIWYPEVFAAFHELILITLDWILTLVVLLLAGVLLACCWCPAPKMEVQSSGTKKKYQTESSPYPEEYEDHSIVEFGYMSDLQLLRLKKRLPQIDPEQQYIVAKDYTVCFKLKKKNCDSISTISITVPRGMLSDLASVPSGFRWLVGRVGPHLEAAIVHDYLYMAWQLEPSTNNGEKISMPERRRFADDLMLAAMRKAGMGCKAYVIYMAVRLFGCGVFKKRNPEPMILCEEKMPDCDDGG